MKNKSNKLFMIFVVLLLNAFVFTSNAEAIKEFTNDQKIIYQVTSRGDTTVIQNIRLTNNFSTIYPQEYHLELDHQKIKNITASDKQGNIVKKISEKNGKTKIKLEFNQSSIGKDKSLAFEIKYVLPQFCQRQGQTWKIKIPTFSDINDIDNLDLQIKTPKNFGTLSFASIKPLSKETLNNQQIIKYQKTQLQKDPLVLIFGAFQVFDFNLNFELNNSKNQMITQQIPIPPETGYQTIILSEINPKPTKIVTDNDFNWLAEYELKPYENKTIKVIGQATIFSDHQNNNWINLVKKTQNLNDYLTPQKYWPVDNQIIQNLAGQYPTSRDIYNLVVQYLEYDYENLDKTTRMGALEALRQKRGVCTEFSDLFITLSRANQIPAREIQGFAFTENQKILSLTKQQDILHSWVEYWDKNKKLWVTADPTWEKTTHGVDFLDNTDMAHFAFVIHGQNSYLPRPPGFYRNFDSDKNINVDFAKNFVHTPEEDYKVNIKTHSDNNNFLVIKNNSLKPIYNLSIRLKGWNNKDNNNYIVDFLPPLGEKNIPINSPGFFQRLFSTPHYYSTIKNKDFKTKYPNSRLNLKSIFAKLW